MTMPNIDDVAQTLAEYERLAISTGATVQILPTEFSADGSTWLPYWIDTEPPVLARATVLRDGIETVRLQVWAESLPAEESWRALWQLKPTKLFGAYADRAALRRAFRDAIGDRREPDEQTPQPAVASDRDWAAEITAAQSAEAVNTLHAEMKAARAVTVALERALRARLAELSTERIVLAASGGGKGDAVADAWTPADGEWPPPAPERSDSAAAVRPAPRDYLPPVNRAARRAATRKKGGRK